MNVDKCHCGGDYQATEKVDIDFTLEDGHWTRKGDGETMQFNIYCENDHTVENGTPLFDALYELRDEPRWGEAS